MDGFWAFRIWKHSGWSSGISFQHFRRKFCTPFFQDYTSHRSLCSRPLKMSRSRIVWGPFSTMSWYDDARPWTLENVVRPWHHDIWNCRIPCEECGFYKCGLAKNIVYRGVAAHLRGMRPNLTAKEDTLMLRRNSNILLKLSL